MIAPLFEPNLPPVMSPPAAPGKSARRLLLEEAAKTIDGPRNEAYGGPEDSFKVIADFWDTYLSAIGFDSASGPRRRLRPHDVAQMMILLKAARVAGSNGEHHDSWVDQAGYAACGRECIKVLRPDGK